MRHSLLKSAAAMIVAGAIGIAGWSYATGWHPSTARYPLQGVEKMKTTGKTLQSSSNTEHVPSLEEAVRLLKTGKYRIRLKCDSVNPAQYNMREWEAVEVVY